MICETIWILIPPRLVNFAHFFYYQVFYIVKTNSKKMRFFDEISKDNINLQNRIMAYRIFYYEFTIVFTKSCIIVIKSIICNIKFIFYLFNL